MVNQLPHAHRPLFFKIAPAFYVVVDATFSMAQTQQRTASAGPKFRRSGNFFFLRCFGFTGKRKTNFKKKSTTDAVTYRTKKPHWFGILNKKYAASTFSVEKTARRDLPLLKPSWTAPNSSDESKLTISSDFQNKLSINVGKLDTIAESCKDVEDEGKCQSSLFSGRSTDMIEMPPEKISKSAPIIAADHTRSISFTLPPSQGKQATVAKTDSRIHRKSEVISERVDPSVGFLIMTLNLVIMLVWGKVCAILCASAFLYIVPRFRTSVQAFSGRRERQSGGPIAISSSNRKSDDWMVKSKVVFDGFLERNRRSSFGHR